MLFKLKKIIKNEEKTGVIAILMIYLIKDMGNLLVINEATGKKTKMSLSIN